jgi:hypothetical protein
MRCSPELTQPLTKGAYSRRLRAKLNNFNGSPFFEINRRIEIDCEKQLIIKPLSNVFVFSPEG